MGRPTLRARVERIHEHASDVRSLFLRTTNAELQRFLPGMFISIAMPLATETRVRPYTIVSSPDDSQPFEVVFNRVATGPGSAWLFDRRVGDEFDFTGPFGAFTLDRPPAAELVFVAEGSAIAPIRPMIRRVLRDNPSHRVHLLYGAACEEHLLYRPEFAGLVGAHPNFRLDTLIDGSTIYLRLLAKVRECWVEADSDRSRHFYICGVGQPVIDMRDLLRVAGYERRAVHYEKW